MADTARVVEPLTPTEYLARELMAPAKHEYVAGAVYAMAGATDRHNRIATNLLGALLNHLPERCVPYMGDMKVRISLERAEVFYYPDSMVCCGPSDLSLHWRDNPILLGEVLSRSTESVDRVDKLEAYKHIPTLEEYVIIEQEKRQVEVYRRANGWAREIVVSGDTLRLTSVDLAIGVDALYRRVDF